MRDGRQTRLSRASEHLAEFGRRVPGFRGIEADCGDRVPVRQNLFEHAHRLGRAQVTQKAWYQPIRQFPLAFGLDQCAAHTGEHGVEGQPRAV